MAIDMNEKVISKKEFSELVKQHGKEAEDLVIDYMNSIPPHKLEGKTEYTVENFRN